MYTLVKEFFTIIYDTAFILQILSVAVACTLVFRKRDKTAPSAREIIFESLRIISVFALMTAIDLLSFIVARYFRPLTGQGVWIAIVGGIALYVLCYCKFSRLTKFVLALEMFALSVIVAQFGTEIGNLIAQNIDGFPIVITKIGSDILIIFFAALMRRYNLSRCKTGSVHALPNIIGCGVTTFIVIFHDILRIQVGIDREASLFMSALLFGLYVVNLATYFATYFLCRERTQTLNLQAEIMKRTEAEELLAVSRRNLEELREIRHDIKNQYSYMRNMIAEKKYKELDAYFEEVTGTFAQTFLADDDCGNDVVNSIMKLARIKAESSGVGIEMKLAVPHELPFRESDLCSLFTNIIDNSIEACVFEKIPDASVEVTLGINGDYMILVVSNPTRKTSEWLTNHAATDKKDKKAHGYGMKIVKKLASRYNGHFGISIENGCFVSELALDLCAEGGGNT